MSATLTLDGATLTLPTAHDTSWDVNLNNTISSIVDKANATETRLDTLEAASATVGTRLDTLEADTVAAAPGGRLSLRSAFPVDTAGSSGAGTVYYIPHHHNRAQLYNGSRWVLNSFSEISQATTDNTKSPAAVVNNSNYDIFLWLDSATVRISRGPPWTSDTGRGSGAGTSQISRLDGRFVNTVAITNGPAAQRGLYVGTIRSNGTATIDDNSSTRHVWNMHNRVPRHMAKLETAAPYNYTTNTYREANGGTNRLSFVRGLDQDSMMVHAMSVGHNTNTGVFLLTAIGLDSTSAAATDSLISSIDTKVAARRELMVSRWCGVPGLGSHFVARLERSAATGTTTWIGDSETGIHAEVIA